MPLVNMKTLLADAQKGGYAVGSFSVANLEMILGVIKAAEETRSPIVLQIAEVRLNHSPLAIIGPAMLAAAKNATVPVAVHLDHGTTIECIGQALRLGFTSVMLDASATDYEENVRDTALICRLAHSVGVSVEAELGHIFASENGLGAPKEQESLESFEKAMDGKATKIIVPSNIQGLAGMATSLKEIFTTDTPTE